MKIEEIKGVMKKYRKAWENKDSELNEYWNTKRET